MQTVQLGRCASTIAFLYSPIVLNLSSNRPAAHRLDHTICQDGRRLFLGLGWVSESESELGERSKESKVVSLHSSDADSAINSMMWQNAGRSGIDQQWSFIMSPVAASQSQVSECQRRITKKWCPDSPELSKLYQKPYYTSLGIGKLQHKCYMLQVQVWSWERRTPDTYHK